jgi:hypothetical protein
VEVRWLWGGCLDRLSFDFSRVAPLFILIGVMNVPPRDHPHRAISGASGSVSR